MENQFYAGFVSKALYGINDNDRDFEFYESRF